jgi:hypothetical protein
MRIVSWRGWEPEDDNIWIGITDDVRGAWNPTIDTRQRNGNTSVIVGSNIEGRPIECEFGNEGTTPRSAEQTWMLGLQRLNPADMTPGELVVEFEDGRECFCQAVISVPGSVVDETVDTFDVVWYSTDNLWHDTTHRIRDRRPDRARHRQPVVRHQHHRLDQVSRSGRHHRRVHP